jgi:mannonate dehydratase
MLSKYEDFPPERLRENLAEFLTAVVPVAEEWGCRMVIHPDDPPRSILGLPRIFSNLDDIKSKLSTWLRSF